MKIPQIDKKRWIQLIEIISFIVVLICITCSVYVNITGRTLWLDEAMLAVSINTRSVLEILQPPLAWNQSAPVGYVLCVKLITLLFGNSEFVLRLFSVLSYIGVIACFYYLIKNVAKAKLPLLSTAAFANIAYLIEYSDMLKPYICDGLFVMLVIVVFHLYVKGHIKLWLACLMLAVMIWFSNPVAFFAGGAALYLVLESLIQKKFKECYKGIAIGLSSVISFGIMYLVWLKPTINNTNLSDFWLDYKFPIITSIGKLKEAMHLTKFALQGLGDLWLTYLVLATIIVIANLFIIKSKEVYVITLGVIITLMASVAGFFPMSDRLFVFMDCILAFLAAYMIFWLVERVVVDKYKILVLVVVFAILLYFGGGIQKYHSGKAYREGEEANEAIEYLEKNIKADDNLYVYYAAIPVFEYKEGYDNPSIGDCKNVYLGTAMLYDKQALDDVRYVSNSNGIYVLYTHVVDYESREDMTTVLNASGSYEKIVDEYLYYYSCDMSKSKGDFAIDLISSESNAQDEGVIKVRITNNGVTHLNNGEEVILLHPEDYDENYKGKEAIELGDILPGESKEYEIKINWNGKDSRKLQIYNLGKYSFEKIGVNSIEVGR